MRRAASRQAQGTYYSRDPPEMITAASRDQPRAVQDG